MKAKQLKIELNNPDVELITSGLYSYINSIQHDKKQFQYKRITTKNLLK